MWKDSETEIDYLDYDYLVKSIEDIIKTANLVGGITTTRIGALESIPTWDELEQYSKLDQI